MGKKGGTSWLTAVKRAFRSPSKDTNRRKGEDQNPPPPADDDSEDKKREKRRWIFRKPTSQEPQKPADGGGGGAVEAEKRHAIAVAVATAAAAEAAMATAQAAVEVARLNKSRPHSNQARLDHAATVIQTAFRGYLARRALCALKGLVKLQALVRGHNVRKQAKMTLKCMQALVRVQSRVLDHRIRLSHEGSRKSAFSDTATIWDSRCLHDISDRKSISQSREGSSVADDWDERPHTIEEVKAMLQLRKDKDATFKRDNTFSQQMRRQGRSPSMGNEDEFEERPKWLDRWIATKPWENRPRPSTDHVKTVEMDTSQPYSYLAPNFRRSSHSQRPSSPLHHRAPVTPSPSKSRPLPLQVRSASPRCGREDRSFQTSQTPSLRSNYYYNANQPRGSTSGSSTGGGALPNYMAATESAKARVRSQSAPRQRPSTPERERPGSVAKKRLSFPVPDPYGMGGYGGNSLRSPSFKSVANSHVGVEQQSNYSSCYTESIGGEISPSASDLRRWLR